MKEWLKTYLRQTFLADFRQDDRPSLAIVYGPAFSGVTVASYLALSEPEKHTFKKLRSFELLAHGLTFLIGFVTLIVLIVIGVQSSPSAAPPLFVYLLMGVIAFVGGLRLVRTISFLAWTRRQSKQTSSIPPITNQVDDFRG